MALCQRPQIDMLGSYSQRAQTMLLLPTAKTSRPLRLTNIAPCWTVLYCSLLRCKLATSYWPFPARAPLLSFPPPRCLLKKLPHPTYIRPPFSPILCVVSLKESISYLLTRVLNSHQQSTPFYSLEEPIHSIPPICSSIATMTADSKPASTFRYNEKPTYTTSNGCPVRHPEEFQRIGQNGPILLQDFHLIDLLAHFDRERIPERVVHAKGAGAYGGMLAQCIPVRSC
jgi:catalase